MGHPKKQKKKFESPKRPWDKVRIEKEKKIKQDFGLRRKKEIWRSESLLRDLRRRARELQAKPDEKMQADLFKTVERLGLKAEKLDDVLSLELTDILSRRLQYVVYKKGLANSIKHARQIIIHGHVYINERKVQYPAFIVSRSVEDAIKTDDRVILSVKPAPPPAEVVEGAVSNE